MLHMNDFLNENKGSGHNYNESIEGGYFSRKVRCINEKKIGLRERFIMV